MVKEPSRRAVIIGGAGALAAAALGGAAVTGALPVPLPHRLRTAFADMGPDGVIPDVPVGTVTRELVTSAARGRRVGFWTAVPAGHGDGASLPVCLILHGGTATTADFTAFGFPQFLTDAVRRGATPFVLAGADGGLSRWEGDGAGDDPQRMLTEEVPGWCRDRGFDPSRLAAYGWSMGGYGSLRLAERNPDLLRAVAALSPAVGPDANDAAVRDVRLLTGERLGIWCGQSDALFPNVRRLAQAVRPAPEVLTYDKGGHTRGFWNRVTPAAFDLVGRHLA